MQALHNELDSLHRRTTAEMVASTGWVNTGQSVGALAMVGLTDTLWDELESQLEGLTSL